MIVAINGIKLDEYFSYTESGFPVYEKVSLKNDTFIINSKLDWNDEHKYDTDSLMFKCRFLTLLLLQLKDKLKKIYGDMVLLKEPNTKDIGYWFEYKKIKCKYIELIKKL